MNGHLEPDQIPEGGILIEERQLTDQELAQIREDWRNWKAVNPGQPHERRTYIYQGPHLPRGFEYRLPPFDASTERVARPLPRWRRWLRHYWREMLAGGLFFVAGTGLLLALGLGILAPIWVILVVGFYLGGVAA